MIRTRDWKYVQRYPDGPNELYNLADDPDERRNLIDDAGQKSRVHEMQRQMADWFAEYVEPDKDGLKYDVRGGGQVHPVGRGWNDQRKPF